MSTETRVSVLVSSCPDTTAKKWKQGETEPRDVSTEAFLVKIVPDKGRASSVFRLYSPMMVREYLERDRLGNPYGIFGDVVQAFTGVSKFSVSMCVLVHRSGNLWEQWNGRATSDQIIKRTKYKARQRAFNVYEDGHNIDTITYGANVRIDSEEVRASLVNHDGYSPSIEVYEEGNGCPECKGELGECCAACGFVG